MSMQPVLTVQALSLHAGAKERTDASGEAVSRTLLADCTQCFFPGELWAVLGPNGAGKTTLLWTLAGLRKPATGTVQMVSDKVMYKVHTMSPAALAKLRALMPQDLHDAFSASVEETVLLGRYPHLGTGGWESAQDRALARQAMHKLGLSDLAGRDISRLSGGERQRVALAAVLAQQAPLMLLDEPLSHLDLHYQQRVLQLLRAQVQAQQDCVLFSCHDLNLARRFATHALLLNGDGTALCGPVEEVVQAVHCSRAYRTPMIELREGEYRALVPQLES